MHRDNSQYEESVCSSHLHSGSSVTPFWLCFKVVHNHPFRRSPPSGIDLNLNGFLGLQLRSSHTREQRALSIKREVLDAMLIYKKTMSDLAIAEAEGDLKEVERIKQRQSYKDFNKPVSDKREALPRKDK